MNSIALTRVCFSEKKRKGKKQSNTLEILPNYPIRNGQICISNYLPKLTSQKHPSEATKKQLKLNQTFQKFVKKSKEKIEKIVDSVGQLVVLFVLKQEKLRRYKAPLAARVILPNGTVTTASLVKLKKRKNAVFGLGCLHSFQIDDVDCVELLGRKKICSSDYERLAYFVKHSEDVSGVVSKIEKIVRNFLERGEGENLVEFVKEKFEILMRERYCLGSFLREVKPHHRILEIRKNYLKENKKYKEKFLDPCFSLQPTPSIDLVTLEISPKFIEDYFQFLEEKSRAKLFAQTAQDIKRKQEEEGSDKSAIIEEHSKMLTETFFTKKFTKQKINKKFLTYSLPTKKSTTTKIKTNTKTLLLGFQGVYLDTVAEGMAESSRGYDQFSNLLDAELFHEHLSITGTVIKENNPQLIVYIGNTSYGSSGSCILDKNCNILGINFGYFYDNEDDMEENSVIEKMEKFRDSQNDIFYFDIEVKEKLENREVEKNRNLAVNLKHEVFRSWVEEWMEDFEEEEEEMEEKEVGFMNFKGNFIKGKGIGLLGKGRLIAVTGSKRKGGGEKLIKGKGKRRDRVRVKKRLKKN